MRAVPHPTPVSVSVTRDAGVASLTCSEAGGPPDPVCSVPGAACARRGSVSAALSSSWVGGPLTNTRRQKPCPYALASSVPCPRGRRLTLGRARLRLTLGRARLRSPWSQDPPRGVCRREARHPVLSGGPAAPRRPPSSGFPRGSWLCTESSREAFTAVPGSARRRRSCDPNRTSRPPGPFRGLHNYLKQNLQKAL